MRLKSRAGDAVPTIMKIALSFSIAASWPGLDLNQTSTFSQRLPKMRGTTDFQHFYPWIVRPANPLKFIWKPGIEERDFRDRRSSSEGVSMERAGRAT